MQVLAFYFRQVKETESSLAIASEKVQRTLRDLDSPQSNEQSPEEKV